MKAFLKGYGNFVRTSFGLDGERGNIMSRGMAAIVASFKIHVPSEHGLHG